MVAKQADLTFLEGLGEGTPCPLKSSNFVGVLWKLIEKEHVDGRCSGINITIGGPTELSCDVCKRCSLKKIKEKRVSSMNVWRNIAVGQGK